jgi:hypothetical protein
MVAPSLPYRLGHASPMRNVSSKKTMAAFVTNQRRQPRWETKAQSAASVFPESFCVCIRIIFPAEMSASARLHRKARDVSGILQQGRMCFATMKERFTHNFRICNRLG